jgi:hypothetical protein
MKYVFAVLLVLSLPLARVGAQGLHGRILVVRDTSFFFPHDLENVLPSIYFGAIDSMFFLPTDLSIYDAVLVKDDTLSISDQLTLIDFVKAGGKLYIESPFSPSSQSDTLLHYLGLINEVYYDQVVSYERFFGNDTEFTRSLNISHAYDEIKYDFAEIYIPSGNFIPVLFGGETSGERDIFAWIPKDTSLHVVVQYYPGFYYGQKPEYYAPFLTRVLCDYFGLCADVVTETPNLSGDITVRAIANGPETLLDISSREPSVLEVSNVLGGTVYRQLLTSGETKAELPASLLNGIYFARVESRHGAAICSFAIVSK